MKRNGGVSLSYECLEYQVVCAVLRVDDTDVDHHLKWGSTIQGSVRVPVTGGRYHGLAQAAGYILENL